MQYFDNGYWQFEGQSDLARIRRQQLFVKKVAHKAQSEGLFNITAINGIFSGIVNNLTVDSGFSKAEMLRLARIYRNFNPNSTPTSTLPTTATVIGGADVLLLEKTQAPAVIAAWQGTPPPGAAPTTSAAPTVTIPASTISVSVLNGSGRTGDAGRATAALQGLGFTAAVGTGGKADNYGYTTPVIRYGPGGQAAAQQVQRDVVGGALLQQDPTLSGTSLVFVTGASYAGFSATASASGSPATAGAAPAAPAPAPSSAPRPAFPGSHGSDPPPPGSGC